MYEIARINRQRMVAGLQSIYLSKGFEIDRNMKC